MAIPIPPTGHPALALLSRLTSSEQDLFLQRLTAAEPTTSTLAFSRRLLPLGNLSEAEMNMIVQNLQGMYGVMDELGLEPRFFAQGIAARMLAEGIGSIAADAAESFTSFLEQVLSSSRTLGVTTKASELLLAAENVFGSAKIVTNLRPIFAQSADERPSAVVAIHSLIISLHGSEKSVVFSLDDADLEDIRMEIGRAIDESHRIRSFSEDAHLFWVDR